MNYEEIKVFESNQLTKREDVIAWNHSYQQALRLETELGPSKVLSEGRFDDTVNEESQVIADHLPCDILNLDYFSQSPVGDGGRIEREINVENILVSLLSSLSTKGFVLLYTTLLDHTDLSLAGLSFSCNSSSTFPDPITSEDDKVEFIENAVTSILDNNNYHISEMDTLILDLESTTDKVFSIGCVALRSS